MRTIIQILFPIRLYLTILQLENYSFRGLLKWVFKNFGMRFIRYKKDLRLTFKAKLLLLLLAVWLASLSWLIFLLIKSLVITAVIIFFLLVQPYLILGLALLVLKPFELIIKKKIIDKTRQKIRTSKNLEIIAITGSFGKTSTKEILFQLLKDEFPVLKTPESFNTVLGIGKVIEFELDQSFRYFVCELGAYKKGEIKELAGMIMPSWGILTGITKQHLEKFGSLEKIITAKFELLDYLKNPQKIVFNLDDENIIAELRKRNIKNVFGYGLISDRAQVKAGNIQFNKNGSSFTLKLENKNFAVKTALFGYSNIKNILAASAMAINLGLSPSLIITRIKNLRPFPNRLYLSVSERATIVNNTYNSNPEGFAETIKTAQMVKGKKVLVTPGLVELGKQEEKEVHFGLGCQAKDTFDKIVLVGQNRRTLFFEKGVGDKDKVSYINDVREEYFKKVQQLSQKFDWIFLENDIPENY